MSRFQLLGVSCRSIYMSMTLSDSKLYLGPVLAISNSQDSTLDHKALISSNKNQVQQNPMKYTRCIP